MGERRGFTMLQGRRTPIFVVTSKTVAELQSLPGYTHHGFTIVRMLFLRLFQTTMVWRDQGHIEVTPAFSSNLLIFTRSCSPLSQWRRVTGS